MRPPMTTRLRQASTSSRRPPPGAVLDHRRQPGRPAPARLTPDLAGPDREPLRHPPGRQLHAPHSASGVDRPAGTPLTWRTRRTRTSRRCSQANPTGSAARPGFTALRDRDRHRSAPSWGSSGCIRPISTVARAPAVSGSFHDPSHRRSLAAPRPEWSSTRRRQRAGVRAVGSRPDPGPLRGSSAALGHGGSGVPGGGRRRPTGPHPPPARRRPPHRDPPPGPAHRRRTEQITAAVAESSTSLTALSGIGDLTAALILARVGHVGRFAGSAQFASCAGVAPDRGLLRRRGRPPALPRRRPPAQLRPAVQQFSPWSPFAPAAGLVPSTRREYGRNRPAHFHQRMEKGGMGCSVACSWPAS